MRPRLMGNLGYEAGYLVNPLSREARFPYGARSLFGLDDYLDLPGVWIDSDAERFS